jgi:phospholipase/lecithinase/hemolysin
MACFIFLLFAPAAFGEADFTEVVTFGDSLTHNDILGLVYGNPQDMYGADPMEALFNKGAIPGDELTNYAVAGSESGHVELQIDLYDFFRLIFLQDKATLFNFEIGGNDILNNADLLSTHAPGENAQADAVIDNIISNIQKNLRRLWSSHPDAQFVIWTIPDVTITPRFWNALTPEEVENIQKHIERVNQRIRNAQRYPFVVVLDLYKLIQIGVSNPPVIIGHQLVPPPDYGDYDRIFADEIHPTAVSNALIANFIIMLINKKWDDTVSLYTQEELADLAHIPH